MKELDEEVSEMISSLKHEFKELQRVCILYKRL